METGHLLHSHPKPRNKQKQNKRQRKSCGGRGPVTSHLRPGPTRLGRPASPGSPGGADGAGRSSPEAARRGPHNPSRARRAWSPSRPLDLFPPGPLLPLSNSLCLPPLGVSPQGVLGRLGRASTNSGLFRTSSVRKSTCPRLGGGMVPRAQGAPAERGRRSGPAGTGLPVGRNAPAIPHSAPETGFEPSCRLSSRSRRPSRY